ncbi:MAG TPA: pyridoxal-phosphate dependent enzyme [Anaerolineales bacterium]
MTNFTHHPIPLEAVRTARRRIAGTVLHTPLIRLNMEAAPAEIYLKLENLQQVGSFKMRGAGNAILSASRDQLAHGVWTASAGNMAQGVAWYARQAGIICTVIIPDDAPVSKLLAIQRLAARIVKVPFADYQAIQREHVYPGMEGMLVHPFGDDAVMAGNGTIGLEILEDLPSVEAIIVPYGGGGLSCGIASAVKATNPQVKVFAAEVATATPLASSLKAGKPVEVPYTSSFVSGMGAPFVFPEMWPLASLLLDGALVVEIAQVVEAIRSLAGQHHVIAEGAGAVALAAALAGKAGRGKVACIVSGGNLDPDKLIKIMQGEIP